MVKEIAGACYYKSLDIKHEVWIAFVLRREHANKLSCFLNGYKHPVMPNIAPDIHSPVDTPIHFFHLFTFFAEFKIAQWQFFM